MAVAATAEKAVGHVEALGDKANTCSPQRTPTTRRRDSRRKAALCQQDRQTATHAFERSLDAEQKCSEMSDKRLHEQESLVDKLGWERDSARLQALVQKGKVMSLRRKYGLGLR